MDTALTRDAGIRVPLICGAMYPCSNPELVAAVSEAGAIGIVQPIALTYVHGHEFRAGLRFIRSLTDRPIGMNALIEDSSSTYRKRMEQWIAVALEEGVRFFVTSLGNPKWVVEMVRPAGGIVYHDVTERKWAEKGAAGGARGFIAVNRRAGGHAGGRDAAQLLEELRPLGLPVVAAGGVGTAAEFRAMLDLGYAGVQCGTRFIATTECKASEPYKRAILAATESDIVLSERITGVPVAVIRTPRIDRMGLHAGPFARWMLRGRRRKRWMRLWYAVRSIRQLKAASLDPAGGDEYWQAGKSVAGIDSIEPAGAIVHRFEAALEGGPRGEA
jgi:nitronate monooxygenase